MIGGPEESTVTSGWVFWITGLAGSGKTTVSRLLIDRMRELPRPAVLLDGDELRRAFGDDLGYTIDDRRRAATRYARLARLIARQGVDVVVATISMFHACRAWNRQHLPRYYEVYLRASPEILAVRVSGRHDHATEIDTAGNIVGRDLSFEAPIAANLEIDTEAYPDGAAVADHAWGAIRRLLLGANAG